MKIAWAVKGYWDDEPGVTSKISPGTNSEELSIHHEDPLQTFTMHSVSLAICLILFKVFLVSNNVVRADPTDIAKIHAA